MTTEELRILTGAAAVVVAIAGAYLMVRLGPKYYGPDADFWELVRRAILPQLNRLARRNGWGYAAYRLTDAEYLGDVGETPDEFEHRLASLGARRMPLAAFKYAPDGRPEAGSWAYRDWLFATRQVHVITFERDDGGTDVFAHDEYNAYNPLVALLHYEGVGYIALGDVVDLADVLANGLGWVREQAEGRRL